MGSYVQVMDIQLSTNVTCSEENEGSINGYVSYFAVTHNDVRGQISGSSTDDSVGDIHRISPTCEQLLTANQITQ